MIPEDSASRRISEEDIAHCSEPDILRKELVELFGLDDGYTPGDGKLKVTSLRMI